MTIPPEPAGAPLAVFVDQARSRIERSQALMLLRASGDQGVVPRLIAVCEDPSESRVLCFEILDALGQIGGDAAEEYLFQQLRAPRTSNNWRSAFDGLAQIHSERVTARLLALADDPEPVFQEKLENYFDALHPKPYTTVGSYSWSEPERGWDPGPFLEASHSSSPRIREYAARALGCSGSAEATAALHSLTRDPHPKVRASAVDALGQQKSSRSVGMLIDTLSDPEPAVRLAVVSALERIGGRQALDALIALVDDPDMHIRYAAISALGALQAVDAVPAFIRHLDDKADPHPHIFDFKYPRVCDIAVYYLKQFNTPEAMAALENWRH